MRNRELAEGIALVGLLRMATLPSLSAQSPTLIGTAELASRLERDAVRGDDAAITPIIVVDVRQSWVSYLQNHLPGAVWLNVETLRAQNGELPFQLLSGAHYAELFTRMRLTLEREVVIYSAGDQADVDATFTAWLLASAGAKHVTLLDGGFAKWDVEGRPLTQRYPRTALVGGPFRPKHFRPLVASLAEVQAAAAGSGVRLVDARPADQFSGAAGAQLRRGHIPGAINHPWKDDLEKPDLALVWKPVDALRASYAAQGITPEQDIILYCNSGTEASHVFFALKYLLGYPRVRIFAGSWSQWSEREELPVEK